ncbi:MAG: hypothetical protein ACK4NC_02140 [Candidatus Gracilibacteria bacterium]
MELFAVEVAKQEVMDLLDHETALTEAKHFSIKSVVEKTQDMATLESIKTFLEALKQERIRVENGVVSSVEKVYQEESKKMLKEIELDYQKIQKDELQKLMNQLQ